MLRDIGGKDTPQQLLLYISRPLSYAPVIFENCTYLSTVLTIRWLVHFHLDFVFCMSLYLPDSVLHIFRVLVGKLVLHFGTSHSKERRIFPTLLQPLFILLLLQLVLPGKRQKDGHQEIHMKAMNIPYPGSSYLPYSANYFEGSLCFHCFCE